MSLAEYEPVPNNPEVESLDLPPVPQIVIDEDTDEAVRAMLEKSSLQLATRPAVSLMSLHRFAAHPDRYNETNRWHVLTNRSNALSYWFDEETEKVVKEDGEMQRITHEKRGDEQGFLKRVRRLEIFMERAKDIRKIGKQALES